MKNLPGKYDFVLITLDTLRYDAAACELEAGNLPTLSPFLKKGWEKRHAPGSFTYPSHHAIFAGFLPTPASPGPHQRLFALSFQGSETTGKNTTVFDAPHLPEGFRKSGYQTICIGGVGFFNQQTPLGQVLPSFFEESYWDTELGVTCKNSAENQVSLALDCINRLPREKRFFLFINISAIHQPNYFYLDDSGEDTLESHKAALRYVDRSLAPLFEGLAVRNDTFCIVCSDHGTSYGEEGYRGHRAALDVVWNVPYTEFLLSRKENQ